MGPTGCGKTEAAIRCADALNVELISVDSALVYRGMDIGTAKPSAQMLKRYPHHLVDVVDPVDSYSAGRFRRDALSLMERISDAGKIPLLVGGTMLYFRVLQQGLAKLPTADPKLRKELDAAAQEHGWPRLHQRLAKLDPESAERIHPNDAQRIQRALEVVLSSGTTLTALHRDQSEPGFPYAAIKVCLAPGRRETLHENLSIRFNTMIKNGFLSEVRSLYERGDLTLDHASMRSVGYRQLWQHLTGELSLEQACVNAVTATRRLAKRQLTWLRKEPGLTWFDALAPDVTEQIVSHLQQQLKAFGLACDTLRP